MQIKTDRTMQVEGGDQLRGTGEDGSEMEKPT